MSPSAAPKGKPFSVRFSASTEQLVEDEARRLRRSKSQIVEAFTEEAARMRRFPGVAFRGDDARRRAWVVGSGLDVWEIATMLRSYDGDEQRLRESHPLVVDRHIRLARAYAERFREEVAPFLEESARPLDELVALYPFLEAAG